MPRDVSALKVIPISSENDCITVVNWNPPGNINANLVAHYAVESLTINSTTLTATVCIIYDCIIESGAQIRIRTVDICDRDGATSDNLIVDLLQTSSNSSGNVTTEQSPTTKEQRKLIKSSLAFMCF
jgi:hypothetical protein